MKELYQRYKTNIIEFIITQVNKIETIAYYFNSIN